MSGIPQVPGIMTEPAWLPGTWNLGLDSSSGRDRHFRPDEDLRTPFDLQEAVKVSRLPGHARPDSYYDKS